MLFYVWKTLLGFGVAFGIAAGLSGIAWYAFLRMPGQSYRGMLPPCEGELLRQGDELEREVRVLTEEIGERNYAHYAELQRAEEYLRRELEGTGMPVDVQAYEIDGQRFANLAAEKRGSVLPDEIVVVGAHYDSVYGTPGANDNGSGVAALLALARRSASREPCRTLRFVAFVNEEPPFFQTDRMGSLHYARRCRERNERIVGMIALETMGCFLDEAGTQQFPNALLGRFYPSAGNFITFVGARPSAGFLRTCIRTFREHGRVPSEGACLPGSIPGVGWSDHWSFDRMGYPAFMVTDTAPFRYPYYHAAEDTLDKIDFHRLALVVEGLDAVIETF